MAKISELSNAELLQSVEKYQKIVDELHRERTRRMEANPEQREELATPEELKAAREKTKTSYSLNLEEVELADTTGVNRAGDENSDGGEDELVGVTQLLSLSKEELAKLQDDSEDKKKGKT